MKFRSDFAPPAAATARPRILIIGHGRHGKGTAAEWLSQVCGLVFADSSEFAAQLAVFPLVADFYPDWQACFHDRANHREMWFHAIAAYDLRPGPTLAEQVLAVAQIYVGMRRRAEFERARHLFDLVIWVDRSRVLPPEPGGSMELTAADADLVLDNNGDLGALEVGLLALIGGRDFGANRP